MPKGVDTRNHPNRRVGRSDLPRLSGALAGLLNNSLQDAEDYGWDATEAEEEFKMKHSMANNLSIPYGKTISETDAQGALAKYRKDRNAGQDLEFYQEDIKDAFRSRNDY